MEGALDYENIKKGRRIFNPEIQVIPEKQKGQKEAFDVNEKAYEYGDHIINLIRSEINTWRQEEYPSVNKVTSELLNYWFLNPDRHEIKQMFFAQRESVETVKRRRVFKNEIIEKLNMEYEKKNPRAELD